MKQMKLPQVNRDNYLASFKTDSLKYWAKEIARWTPEEQSKQISYSNSLNGWPYVADLITVAHEVLNEAQEQVKTNGK